MGTAAGDEDRTPERKVRIPGFVIRRYRPGDRDEAQRIFAGGIMALAGPAFRMSALAPLNLCLLLAASAVVHALTASATCAAAVSLALLSLVYLWCRHPFAAYTRQALMEDMADIEGHYLSGPGSCFWVAQQEGEGEGGTATAVRLAGIVAAKAEPPGLPTACHLYRLSVDPPCRRRGLARALTQVVLDFARDGGFHLCALSTTNVQQPALRLYRSMGFRLVRTAPVSLGLLSPFLPIKVCHLERRLELDPPPPHRHLPDTSQADGGDSNPEEELESAA